MKFTKDPIEIIVIIVVIAAVLLFASGSLLKFTKFGSDKVKSGSTIKVEYTGQFENGTIFDSSEIQGKPLEFKVGAGQMIKGFDEAVVGMKLGEEKTIKLQPSDAYGNYNPELVATIPRKTLPDKRPIQPGMMILVGDPASGQQIPALITEANENNFTINMNHPLAGKTLIFKVKIASIS